MTNLVSNFKEKFNTMTVTHGRGYAILVPFAAFALIMAVYAIEAALLMAVWNFIANIFSLPAMTYSTAFILFVVYAIVERTIHFKNKKVAKDE